MSGDGGGGGDGVGEEGVSAAAQAEAAGTSVGFGPGESSSSSTANVARANLAVIRNPTMDPVTNLAINTAIGMIPGASLGQLAISGISAVAEAMGIPGEDAPATGAGEPGEPGGPSDITAPFPVPFADLTGVTPAVTGVDLVARDNKLAEEARDIAAKAAETKAKARAARETGPLRLLASKTAQTRIATTALGLTGSPANLSQPSLLLGG